MGTSDTVVARGTRAEGLTARYVFARHLDSTRGTPIDSSLQDLQDALTRIQGGGTAPTLNPEDLVGSLTLAVARLELELARQHAQRVALARVVEKANQGRTLDEVFDHVYGSFRALIPYDRIGVALLTPDGHGIASRWVRSEAPEILLGPGQVGELSRSSLRNVLRTGETRILHDLVAYLEAHPKSRETALLVQEGLRSSLTCPLVADGRPVGVLFFSSMQVGAYSEAHEDLFLEVANELSLIIEKARLVEDLLAADREKNRFLGLVAHDLRSPLTVVRGFVELLLRGTMGEVPTAQRDILQRVSERCEGMLALTTDLLDVAAIASGRLDLDLEDVDVSACLDDCLAGGRLLARRKEITVTVDVEGELPRVQADPQRLGQVLDNLVSNAIKFSSAGGAVWIRAAASEDSVVLRVEDTGQGIKPEELDQLFSEFGRTSTRPTAGESSTGLGLAIVQRIVHAHGGRVWAESTWGQGTSVSFTLPRA